MLFGASAASILRKMLLCKSKTTGWKVIKVSQKLFECVKKLLEQIKVLNPVSSFK